MLLENLRSEITNDTTNEIPSYNEIPTADDSNINTDILSKPHDDHVNDGAHDDADMNQGVDEDNDNLSSIAKVENGDKHVENITFDNSNASTSHVNQHENDNSTNKLEDTDKDNDENLNQDEKENKCGDVNDEVHTEAAVNKTVGNQSAPTDDMITFKSGNKSQSQEYDDELTELLNEIGWHADVEDTNDNEQQNNNHSPNDVNTTQFEVQKF